MKTTRIKPVGSLINGGSMRENTKQKNIDPRLEEHVKLVRETEAMYAKMMLQFSDVQSDNNVKKGIAGEVELFN